MKKLKVCTCSVRETGTVDGGRIALWAGLALHLLFMVMLWYAFSVLVAAVYAAVLIVAALMLKTEYGGKGHSASCARRKAIISVLDAGTFISPF